MSFKEKLFEGKYNYLQQGKVYTEENFTVLKEDKMQGGYTYTAEVLSRVRTGEFLKIYVEAEFAHNFDPLAYRVRRNLGDKESLEEFYINQKDKNYIYTFEGFGGKHQFERIVNGKPHIASPCFVLSTVMINSKKLDPVHRTTYSVITSNNVWECKGPFVEKEVIFELQELDQIPLKVSDKELKATHCKIVYTDEKGQLKDHYDDIFMSKYNYIPYKAVFSNGLEIEVESLRNFEQHKTKF